MKFALGEIVIMVGGHANGAEAEVTVVGAVMVRPGAIDDITKDYRVQIAGYPSPHPLGWACMEASLRKKRPPEEDINWVEKLNLKAPKEKVT